MDDRDLFGGIDMSNIIPIIALGAVQEVRNSSNTPIGSKDGILSGADYLRELLNSGNESRIYRVLRMKKDTFQKLCSWCRTKGGLKESRTVPIEQQVAQFLWILNYSASLDSTAERFSITKEPVSR
jgi:hypothetical protein